MLSNKNKRRLLARISEIRKGQLNSDILKLLLIEARDAKPDSSHLLKEVAHFVGHPDRDRGIAFEQASFIWNWAQTVWHIMFDRLEVDLFKLPKYAFKTAVGYYRYCDRDSKKESLIRERYVPVDDHYNCILLTESLATILYEALTQIHLKPFYDVDVFLDQFMSLLKMVEFDTSYDIMDLYQNDIIACLMSILHGAPLRHAGEEPSTIVMSTTDNWPSLYTESTELCLAIVSRTPPYDQGRFYVTPLLLSGLTPTEWCTDEVASMGKHAMYWINNWPDAILQAKRNSENRLVIGLVP